MLTIEVPKTEYFNQKTSEFVELPETILQLEHSLYSIAKWESKWAKPFLSDKNKTNEEILDYVNCMIINDVPNKDLVLRSLTNSDHDKIAKYIDQPMTATWFREQNKNPSRKIVTAEVIYYWMIAQNIPFECQHWHLNRLLTLIKVCSAENAPKKKMSKAEEVRNRSALNKARRSKLSTRG